jgi:ribosome-associated protein
MSPTRKTSTRRLPAQVQKAIAAAHDKKASEVIVLDLRPADAFADFFVICTGRNTPQIKAISDSIQMALADKGSKPSHIEGYERAGWILLDYFDFIVHIFSPESRAFYGLERLWGSAERIDVADPQGPA